MVSCNTLKCVALVGAAATVVWYGILRFRLIPKKFMQLWFIFTMVLVVFPGAFITRPINALQLIGVPRSVTTSTANIIFGLSLRVCYWLNPQIKMTVEFGTKADGTKYSWKDFKAGVSCAVLMNHTSFWDTFLYTCIVPASLLFRTRSLMKASLSKLPIVGYAFGNTGHFFVYFKSDEEGNFHVDQEKQAPQTKLLEAHLAKGGTLALFPEGAINKTPETLLPFRFGTFATIHQYRLPIFYMVCVGNQDTWPAKAPVGGFPADIRIRIGGFPVDFDKVDGKELSLMVREKMQEEYTDLSNSMKKKKQ